MDQTELEDLADRSLTWSIEEPQGEAGRNHAWLALLGCSILQLPIWGM